MSTETTSGRNRLLVPAVAVAIVLLIIIGFLVVRGGDEEPVAPKATPKAAKTTAAPKAPQAKVAGSGVAPEAITVKTATVARGASVFAVGAELPDIDIKKIDTVTLVLAQDNGAVVAPQDTPGRPGRLRDPAALPRQGCDRGAVRLHCRHAHQGSPADDDDPAEVPRQPAEALRARLEITDRNGGQEKTANSKMLKAPKT